ISVVIIGDGGHGKSCITMRLVRGQWVEEYDPTIEDSYSTTRVIDGKTYNLDIIDTAGQEEYRGLLSGLWQSSKMADAYLLVYDITSALSLEVLDEFDELISRAVESTSSLHPPIKMVVGNKCDLAQQQRAVTSEDGLHWARRHGCSFMETSALMTVNIEETFAVIIRRVRDERDSTTTLSADPFGSLLMSAHTSASSPVSSPQTSSTIWTQSQGSEKISDRKPISHRTAHRVQSQRTLKKLYTKSDTPKDISQTKTNKTRAEKRKLGNKTDSSTPVCCVVM
ncbi:P-loop containing nucleoside triphosphate hydrolase protein, partial [Limtongia smithiae]|uniref:P-loop containing nucleoside triphosphate hydrolase protein n=1 Tax=Limtongia smithiae TaxID=1125753 RepID=UPI0034CF4D3D